MDQEMFLLKNVMPVEIAIKRELEYRKKLEMSINRHTADLIPLVGVERPTKTGIEVKKWPESSYSHGIYMPQSSSNVQPIHKSHSGLVCLVCQKPFAAFFLLKQHGETLVHKGRLIHMRRQGAIHSYVSNPFHCELCNSSCSSSSEMEYHLNGRRHAESLEMFERAKRARARGGFTANQ